MLITMMPVIGFLRGHSPSCNHASVMDRAISQTGHTRLVTDHLQLAIWILVTVRPSAYSWYGA